jgi:hypothetical protein
MDGQQFGLSTEDSPYFHFNSTLRKRDAAAVERWADFSFLFCSALDKLPSKEITVFRGLNVPLSQVSHEFKANKVVWLVSVTSTTSDEKDTLQSFGTGANSRPGTLMKIRALFAKDIQAFSMFKKEAEWLLAPNTCLSIEKVLTSHDLADFEGLGVPENVDLILARQQHVSAEDVLEAQENDKSDLAAFQTQQFLIRPSASKSSSIAVPVVAPQVAQMPSPSAAQPPSKRTPPPLPNRPPTLSLSSSSSKPPSPAATLGGSKQPVDPNALAAAKIWCDAKGNYTSVSAELKKNRLVVSKENDDRFFDKSTVAACVLCNKSFSIFVKKHHCYVCGKIVCDDCSKHKLQGCTVCCNWQGACLCAKPKFESMRMCKRCHSFGGLSSSTIALKEGLELSRVAVDTAHRALSSFGIGSDPSSLARSGCSLSDLQRAGFETSVLQLKAVGLLAKDLKVLGFKAADLKGDGCFDAGSLKDAGFSCSELVSAGLDPRALKSTGYLMSDFIAAGCDCAYLKSCGFNDVSSFKAAGFSASSMKSAGFPARDLSAAYDLASLQAAGFSAEELRLANFDASTFKNAGYDAVAMKNAGFGIASLMEAGVSLSELKSAGFGADAFKTCGCDALALRTIGFTCEQLKAVCFLASELSIAGFDIKALKNAGYDAAALKMSGHQLKALAAVGYSGSELKACGYDASDLKSVGFDAVSLKAAAFGAAALKTAEFNAHTLKAAGYSLDSLQVAGFKVLELKAAGFTASQFKSIATRANELKDAGFSLASLIDAGYDLKSLRLAGFSVQDLIDNGKKDFHELLDAGFANSALVAAGLVDEVFSKYYRACRRVCLW